MLRSPVQQSSKLLYVYFILKGVKHKSLFLKHRLCTATFYQRALYKTMEWGVCLQWKNLTNTVSKSWPRSTCCCCLVVPSCPVLCEPMDCSLPASSVDGIFQTRILDRIAISFSNKSSWPWDQTHVSCVSWIGRQTRYRLRHQESP